MLALHFGNVTKHGTNGSRECVWTIEGKVVVSFKENRLSRVKYA